ncbi:probable LRR receptor-like serine/threonine-protein kinase At3g47570 [Cajanus cajan]|uniref:probable LRR receptor-like serine/threonine-protein kinase At3g47570 n=1 Tax=Cajanus cajan TaxID=3821 RepID=UPI0010FB05B4|nr:probable LRR receptor-like serine/threonine-protein kinase At3g47570 [Cajanus cajan]
MCMLVELHIPNIAKLPMMIYVRLLLLLCFLLYHFDDITCNNDTERDVLLSFKLQVSDPENALSSWSSDSNHCTWIGVTCYEDGKRVQSLDLAGNALSGKLPPQLSNLTYLNSLDLSQNNFYGQIPQEFGHLQLVNMVQSLDLAGNALSGKLPPQLSNLTYLNSLDLSQNNFYGQIPQEFGHLQRLGNLDLSLARNSFVGDIPTQLGNLLNLSSLQLSENNLSGHFPTSIFSISSLVLLYVENNNLSGNLAHNFGHDLPNLNFLSLGTNRFEGVIPNSISNASNLQYIDLANNKFHGPLPLFNNMINLTYLALDNNFLSPTTSLTFQFFDYLSNSTQLNMLKINDNHLVGELPNSFANLSSNLKLFYVDNNWLTGNFPQEIKKFENLLSLSFANNFFTGELPSEIGALHMLQNFATDGNRFSGEIPDIFGNLTNLYTLAMGNNQFSGRIHTSIGQCNRLFSLDLGMNRIGGTIPKEIFQLSYLTYLNLTGNSLHGSLPREVGTMTQLQTVDISSNQLSGKIPKEIEGCSSLKTLVMARNKFNGSIPTNLGNLEFLETLDLSSNNLTGPIPQSLQKLRYIETLNLSFNHLECEVPMKGVFLNLTKFDFRGNNQLCSLNREIVHNFQKKKRKILLPIILAVVGATALFISMLLLFCTLMSRKKKRKEAKTGVSSAPSRGLPQNISYGDIRIATNNFAAENLIGKGSFGCVYKGFFSFSTGETATLAVKVLDLQQSKASKSFNVECEALKSVRHRNLVKVITSCSSLDYKGEEFKAIVMQFMANGNLDASLYPKDVESGSSLTLLQRLNIAIDVASALDYLHHDCDPPIVHCDLKPANVLLDENMVARVADFGLARFLSQSKSEMQSSTLGIKGSIGYIAPEYGVGGKASTHGDVYSFGILLLEMFTGKRPTDEMFKEGLSLNKFVSTMEENQVLRVVDRRLIDDYEYSTQSSSTGDRSSSIGDNTHRTCKAEECVAAVIRVGLCCSTHRPKDRWRMRDATTKLQAIRQSMLAL